MFIERERAEFERRRRYEAPRSRERELLSLKRELNDLPRFLRHGKENRNPIDSFRLSPDQTKVAEKKIEKAKMSADFSRILKQINLSPIQKKHNNSLNALKNDLEAKNPFYPMRTKIPTTSSLAQREAE